MHRPLLLAVAAAVVACVLAWAAAAHAQVCGDRAALVERLATKYGESLVGAGISSDGTMLEVWASEASGTWSMLMTLSENVSCLIASGGDWNAGGWSNIPAGEPT